MQTKTETRNGTHANRKAGSVSSQSDFVDYVEANWPPTSGLRGVVRQTVLASISGMIGPRTAANVLHGIETDLRLSRHSA